MKHDSEMDQVLLKKEGSAMKNIKCHDGFYKMYK